MSNDTGYSREVIEYSGRGFRKATYLVIGLIAAYLIILAAGWIPSVNGEHEGHSEEAVASETADHLLPAGSADEEGPAQERYVPPLWAIAPFALILLAIAVLPLIPATSHWWEHNINRFLVAMVLAAVTFFYYGLLHPGGG